MRSLVYTNPLGQSLTLYHDPYLITKLEGIDLPTANMQEQKAPFQDGTTYLDVLFDPRTIVVTGSITVAQDLSEIFIDRASALAVLNPKNGPGVLTYTNDNGVYTVSASVLVISYPDKPADDPRQTFQFQFYANDPYWYANTGLSVTMAIVTGGFTFPFSFPFSFGNYVGNIPAGAINSGDSVTPVIITINGPSVNPVVTNTTTGELIKCNISLQPDDVLSINTKYGSKSIVLTSGAGVVSNQMATLDVTSTFWQLAIGSNLLTFTDDSNAGPESCIVSWFDRYSGR